MQKFFVIYGGNGMVSADVMNHSEIVELAKTLSDEFKPENYETDRALLIQAEKVLLSRYSVFGMYERTSESLAEFLSDARKAGEKVGLAALELANKFADEAQRIVMAALTEHQKIAMARVDLPVASTRSDGFANKRFSTYQESIALIRGMSIASLREYVENGDQVPE
jgi:hypothetical protein